MTFKAARVSLATSAAIAMIVAVGTLPASAQTKTWPAGTDCTKLVGNDKTECAHQAKNTASPDNSNNPSTPGNDAITTGTTVDTNGNATTTGTDTNASGSADTSTKVDATVDYKGKDCSALVGNSKEECSAQNKESGEPDNSNNPAKSDPAQN